MAIAGTAQRNSLQGSYIGVGYDGVSHDGLGNPIGVFLNRAGGNTVGGVAPGAGNLITQSNNPSSPWTGPVYGVEILGPPVAGCRRATPSWATSSGSTRIRRLPTRSTRPRGPGSGSTSTTSPATRRPPVDHGSHRRGRNIISGNNTAGVEIVGPLATGNMVQGNFIGTDISGTRLIVAEGPTTATDLGTTIWNREHQAPGAVTSYQVQPTQSAGVLINQASSNFIGSGNLISGNLIGVDIEGQGGDSTKGASNLVHGNFIGTGLRRNDPRAELRVRRLRQRVAPEHDQRQPDLGQRRGGVVLFGGVSSGPSAPSLGNTVVDNQIGVDALRQPKLLRTDSRTDMSSTPSSSTRARTGNRRTTSRTTSASSCTGSRSSARRATRIGQPGHGNTIGGNILTGIYVTSHDFIGNTYAPPASNTIQSNTIVRNGMYGVYRYDAPQTSNVVDVSRAKGNHLSGNPITVGDYVTRVNTQTLPQPNPQPILLPPPLRCAGKPVRLYLGRIGFRHADRFRQEAQGYQGQIQDPETGETSDAQDRQAPRRETRRPHGHFAPAACRRS